jgi:NAD-dependent deacetylase
MFSETLLKIVKTANSVVVLTGAGISAESGVPTFRGEEGLWKKFRPEELANFEAFIQNPKLVWDWYDYRKNLIEDVAPNEGHYALVEIEKRYPDFWLVTQNVDNLHQKAGNLKILELHGNIWWNKCVSCGVKSKTLNMEEGELPLCQCGGLMRPDVVWFGEMLSNDVLDLAISASKKADLFLSIGTSSVVQPAASLPMIAKRNGAYTLEINIKPTIISDMMDEVVLGPSGEILPALLDLLKKYDGLNC